MWYNIFSPWLKEALIQAKSHEGVGWDSGADWATHKRCSIRRRNRTDSNAC